MYYTTSHGLEEILSGHCRGFLHNHWMERLANILRGTVPWKKFVENTVESENS